MLIDGKTERDNPKDEGGQTAGVSGPGAETCMGWMLTSHIIKYPRIGTLAPLLTPAVC